MNSALYEQETFAGSHRGLETSTYLHPSTQSLAKRFLDVLGAIVGLLITSVLFLPIAALISLDSPGRILFQQTRYGLHGKPFQIYKFRTMVSGADALKHEIDNEASGPIFKNQNDPRVTRIGRVLRSTSLDEFPQFWNVLRGEMSLVGTRPPTVDEVESYDPHHWARLHVKPGITGEWQVSGRSSVDNFEEIFNFDIAYQSKWTPIYDLYIIWKTIAAVLSRKDAW